MPFPLMTPFDKAVKIILSMEGQHSYDQAGGDTYFGIARNYHPEVYPWPPTKEQAIEIYRSDYWLRYRCGDLPEVMAIALFDAVVNQPAAFAIAELQRILKVVPDGVIGPETVAAAAHDNVLETLALFFAHRALRYATVSDLDYRLGLIARLFRVQRLILFYVG